MEEMIGKIYYSFHHSLLLFNKANKTKAKVDACAFVAKVILDIIVLKKKQVKECTVFFCLTKKRNFYEEFW